MTNEEAMRLGARCETCPCRGAPLVPAKPPTGKVRLAIVGDAPGRTEEKMGEPFVGMSGQLLNATLLRSSFLRKDAYVTNAALCRSDLDKENDRAAECCAPRLLRELRENVPAAIPLLLAGKSAARSVLGVRTILAARGFVWTLPQIDAKRIAEASRKAAKLSGAKKANEELRAETLAGRQALAGRYAVPTLSPSFILRADTWAPVFRIDVARAVRLSRGEVKFPLESEVVNEAGNLKVLKGLGPVISADIETNGIDPHVCGLLCVGFSDGAKTAVVWPWKASYAKPLAKWLSKKEKVIFHNGFNFDLLVLRKHGVVW